MINNNNNNNNGQIFVIGALLLALILVSLAFSLNLVIYSENTSARGNTVADSNSVEFQNQVNKLVRRMVEKQNQQLYMDRSNITTSTSSAMDLLINAESKRQSGENTSININYSTEYGVLLAQDDFARTLESDDGDSTWELTSARGDVHKFKQRIDTSSLSSYSQSDLDGNGGISGLGAYNVEFEKGTGLLNRNVYIYKYTNNGNIRVQVEGNTPCTISGSESEVSIDYVNATVNGSDCDPLNFVSTNDFEIQFRNGNNGKGVYGIIMGGEFPESNVVTNNYVNPNTSSSSPYYHHITVGMNYNSEYLGPKQNYESNTTYTAKLPSDVQ